MSEVHECPDRIDDTTEVMRGPYGWWLFDGEYTHPITFCPYCAARLPVEPNASR